MAVSTASIRVGQVLGEAKFVKTTRWGQNVWCSSDESSKLVNSAGHSKPPDLYKTVIYGVKNQFPDVPLKVRRLTETSREKSKIQFLLAKANKQRCCFSQLCSSLFKAIPLVEHQNMIQRQYFVDWQLWAVRSITIIIHVSQSRKSRNYNPEAKKKKKVIFGEHEIPKSVLGNDCSVRLGHKSLTQGCTIDQTLTDFSYWLLVQRKEQTKWISTSTRSPLCLQWPSAICWWMLTHASQFFTASEGERGHTHAHWHLLCEPVASSHPEGTENNSPHTTLEERPSRECWQYISNQSLLLLYLYFSVTTNTKSRLNILIYKSGQF